MNVYFVNKCNHSFFLNSIPFLISLFFCHFIAIPSQAFEIADIQELKLEPDSLVLEHQSDMRRVLVSGKLASGEWRDISHLVRYAPGSSFVQIDNERYICAAQVGKTKVTVSIGEKEIDLPVEVKSIDSPPISFVRDIMPALSKIGCNAGTCHGSAKGKNGFKLSLRGYDPEFDYHSLVKDITGRRFNRADPDQSLMLLKPTQGIPHEGGQLFTKGSRQYQIIHQWIQEGVYSDFKKVKRAERLEIFPKQVDFSVSDIQQQMLVIAYYADGSNREVTQDANFTSSNPEVATVSDQGMIASIRRGEAALLVRYEGVFHTTPIVVMGDRSGFEWVEVPEYNFIDTLVYNKLKHVKIQAAAVCTEEQFIRRVYLDLTGQAPTPEAVRAFLTDTINGKGKRASLIQSLLETEEFIDHWTHKFADLLQCNRLYLGEKGTWLYRMWIRDFIAKNKPYDQFVQELLKASGSTFKNPAANFYRVNNDPTVALENMTQVFLGVRFACAKCHDHPFEKWTQNQYYQLGAFFENVGIKKGQLPGEEIVYTKYSNSEFVHPKTNAAITAQVPFGETDSRENMRAELAKWLTSKSNPLFVQSTVNRIWSYFLGRGIIDPVDDIRNSNPPSNPKLLEALAEDFVASGFDLRELMKTIVSSRVYQHSIQTNRWNEDDVLNFSRAVPRRLTAEQMLDSIRIATGSQSKFTGLPEGIRACQLPDSRVEDGGFLKLFGRPDRESSCECERASEVSLSHALNLINGPTISDAIIDPQGRIANLIKKDTNSNELIEEVYLATLSRYPREPEVKNGLVYFEKSESREEGAQDLLWALLNSPAFLFNR